MKKLVLIISLFTANQVFCQDWHVKKMVMTTKAKQIIFKKIPAFNFVASKVPGQRGYTRKQFEYSLHMPVSKVYWLMFFKWLFGKFNLNYLPFYHNGFPKSEPETLIQDS